MEALKDSKVEWLGKIPEDWKVERIGTLYSLRNSKVSDEDYPPLSVTMQGILPQLETVAKTDDHSNRKLVKKGDFAINSRSDRRGSCGISDYDGSVSLINIVLKPNAKMNPVYYNWLFHTSLFADEFYKWGHGIVDDLWTTNWQDMKNIFVTIPPLDEQKLIADFLDEKCAEIDNLSEDIQKQIDILNDYKKSIITRAVTKGLNPNVKKKDSGQLHIGDIPEEWEIVRVKDVFKMQSGFTPDSKRTDYYDDVNGFNWVTIADINKKSDLPETTKSKISKKYIEAFHPRMAKAGSLLYSFKLSIGQVAFVKKDTYTNEAIISFSCKDTRNLRFLKYSSSLIEYNANTNIYGSKILNQQLIGNAHITLPPIDEQDHIADYLDDFTAKMSDIIDEKNNQLEKIDLYKKSIIYEYVTGKKRVKGAL